MKKPSKVVTRRRLLGLQIHRDAWGEAIHPAYEVEYQDGHTEILKTRALYPHDPKSPEPKRVALRDPSGPDLWALVQAARPLLAALENVVLERDRKQGYEEI